MQLQLLICVEPILVQLLSMVTGQAVFAVQRKGKPYLLCSSQCYIGQLKVTSQVKASMLSLLS